MPFFLQNLIGSGSILWHPSNPDPWTLHSIHSLCGFPTALTWWKKILLLLVPCSEAHWNALTLSVGPLGNHFFLGSWHFASLTLGCLILFSWEKDESTFLSVLRVSKLNWRFQWSASSCTWTFWDMKQVWGPILINSSLSKLSSYDSPFSSFMWESVDQVWFYVTLLNCSLRIHC